MKLLTKITKIYSVVVLTTLTIESNSILQDAIKQICEKMLEVICLKFEKAYYEESGGPVSLIEFRQSSQTRSSSRFFQPAE